MYPIEKELKNSLKNNFVLEIRELKRTHDIEICALRQSFAIEIENLQEVISTLSQKNIQILNEKSYHGAKFIEILNKAKGKNKEIKTENKRLSKKLAKLQEEFDKLTSEYNAIGMDKEKLENEILKLKETDEQNTTTIKGLTKKLYKVEADGDLINLDPYELHRKIRYYETQLDTSDKRFMSTKKELTEISEYLEFLGITKEDLKKSWATGVIQFNSFNSKCFDIKSKRIVSPAKKRPKEAKSMIRQRDQKKSSAEIKAKREKFKKSIRVSKSGINEEMLKEDPLEINSLSISSDSEYLTKRCTSLFGVENTWSGVKSINDFNQSKPTSNLDILKHLDRLKDSEEVRNSSSSQSSDNSFHMKSRKRGYEEKIMSTKFCDHIII